jgi:hypothetical protein
MDVTDTSNAILEAYRQKFLPKEVMIQSITSLAMFQILLAKMPEPTRKTVLNAYESVRSRLEGVEA